MKAFKKELTMLGVLIALVIITAILNPSFLGATTCGTTSGTSR